MKNRGFTLYIAIVLMGTLFLISAGIVSLAVRQSLIAVSGRESQHAFYAADSGIECALYWDVHSPQGQSAFSLSTGSQISCNNQTMTVGGNAVSTFTLDLLPDSYCAVVTVTKSGSGEQTLTTIESRGYNTCSSANPRRVERGVRAIYSGSSGGVPPTQCSDGVDNSDPEDTLVDMADPGCSSTSDDNETDVAPPPPSSGYSYYRAVTVDHTKVPNTDQADFPMLFSGTYNYLKTVANGGDVSNASGYDVIFSSDALCSAKLDHEIETYSGSSGLVNFWVRIPSLSHTTDTVVYLCYGNSNIVASQENKTGTWNSAFKGVWHLPNGSALSASDSTGNVNNLTNNNSVTATAGKVDGSANFAGSQYLRIATFSTMPSATLTLSGWVKAPLAGVRQAINYVNRSPSNFFNEMFWRIDANGKLMFSDYDGTQGFNNTTNSNSVVADNNWHHVAFTRNGLSGVYYVDGVADGVKTANHQVTYGSNDFVLGYDYRDSTHTLGGSLDEYRISNVARSADWLKTEYNNQNSPSTFYSVGTAFAP